MYNNFYKQLKLILKTNKLFTFFSSHFNFSAHHDNNSYLTIPQHRPEIIQCVWEWTLRGYITFLHTISLFEIFFTLYFFINIYYCLLKIP